jgi:hypothetical protein
MQKAQDQIGNLRIAVPCQAAWEGMAGDDRVRHCTLCSLNVYNFAEMTRDEVRDLLVRTEGRVCARLYRRADGTVLTRDCPTGLRALRRRASRVAAALIAALLTLPSLAFGRTNGRKPRLKTQGSRIELEIERVATPQPAIFDGVVGDEAGNPIPGVSIVVQDEASKCEITAVTDVNGAFNIASLNDGVYRVDVTLQGIKPARVEHLQLKAGEVTHANVAMRFCTTEAITVGAIAEDWMTMNSGVSTTFSQDFINKMP